MCRSSEKKKKNTINPKSFWAMWRKYYLSLGFVESKIPLDVLLS